MIETVSPVPGLLQAERYAEDSVMTIGEVFVAPTISDVCGSITLNFQFEVKSENPVDDTVAVMSTLSGDVDGVNNPVMLSTTLTW